MNPYIGGMENKIRDTKCDEWQFQTKLRDGMSG